MCGIFTVVSDNIKKEKAVKALQLLSLRGPDEEGIYQNNDIFFGHKRLVVVDPDGGKQPYRYKNYVMIYNGELYNTEDLRQELKSRDYSFIGHSDTEVLIKMYAEFDKDCVEKLNGIFSFVVYNTKTKEVFAARDRAGVKPLYYYHHKDEFAISSEIKSILSYYNINKVNTNSLQEIIGLGPSHSPGNGIYPHVYELRGGHFLCYNNKRLNISRYWQLPQGHHTDDFTSTVDNVRYLLEDTIHRQLVADVPLCTFLSGGLDSTIITLLAQKHKPDLETFSVDYKENEKHFKNNSFQVSQDAGFASLVAKKHNIKHHRKIIDNDVLVDYLDKALALKDMPGMVDIDASLLWFSQQIKPDFTVALSGECADEIFGGYPWFYKEPFDNNFPWLRNLEQRNNFLSKEYKHKLDLKSYVNNAFNASVSETPLVGDESQQEKKHKQLVYLNMVWFMQTLLDRKDRMTMGASLEVRVPFSDHRIMEYLYNVPWDYKFYNGYEKGLLREAVKDIVPYEILTRKKNPYPKTFNPQYYSAVAEKLRKVLKNKDSVLYEVFDIKQILKLLSDDENDVVPWFGQLMTKPQLVAYLYQFDKWFETYNLDIVR